MNVKSLVKAAGVYSTVTIILCINCTQSKNCTLCRSPLCVKSVSVSITSGGGEVILSVFVLSLFLHMHAGSFANLLTSYGSGLSFVIVQVAGRKLENLATELSAATSIQVLLCRVCSALLK